MAFVRNAVKRTCMAFAIRFGEQQTVALSLTQPSRRQVTRLPSRLASSSSSSFTPPEPPTSKVPAIYPDIDFAVGKANSSEAFKRNADPGAVFVVTGASRGIGLEMVKSLVERTEGTVVACCRSPQSGTGLTDLVTSLERSGASHRVHVIPLDLEDQSSIDLAASVVRDKYGRVDVLLNVAGILGDGTTTPGPERSLSKLDRSWVEKTLAINLIGPVMLSKELAPLMKTKERKPQNNEVRAVTVIANLSARVGSISDNELGGWYSYRFSKSALNQATRTMAHELKRQGTWSVALHPGTTDTDLSKPFQRNVQDGRLFPVDFTAGRLLDVIESMKEEHSGGLYDWAGKALPF